MTHTRTHKSVQRKKPDFFISISDKTQAHVTREGNKMSSDRFTTAHFVFDNYKLFSLFFPVSFAANRAGERGVVCSLAPPRRLKKFCCCCSRRPAPCPRRRRRRRSCSLSPSLRPPNSPKRAARGGGGGRQLEKSACLLALNSTEPDGRSNGYGLSFQSRRGGCFFFSSPTYTGLLSVLFLSWK